MTDKEFATIKRRTEKELMELEQILKELEREPNALMEKYITARLKIVREKEDMIRYIERCYKIIDHSEEHVLRT